ncbi:MAG: hypothetical protein FJ146_07920 [Deltaproteobacteria bacterium]|nr:hypothetical protein [Deltaproteobacteria bacterium]
MNAKHSDNTSILGGKTLLTGIWLIAFFLSVRPSTTLIPWLGISFSQWVDQAWDQMVADPQMRSRAFDERFGSAYEKLPHRLRQFASDVSEGKWTARVSEPYLGEPLAIAGVVRLFPEIENIAVSSQLTSQDELYQRLFEGLYPVLVSEGFASRYRLMAPGETTDCQLLGATKEAQLVRCP